MIYLDEPDLDYIPSTRGDKVREFERACADYLGVDDCVAVNSGTSALFLSLLACGIGPKDEVLVPACTFAGTANAVLYTGANVKLIDVDGKTWCISQQYEKYLKRKTKAIIPVSLYGCTFNLTDYYSAQLIFDLAEAFPLSAPGCIRCYSFNGNKTITTGGGGLIVGQNLDKIRAMLIPGLYDGLGWNMGMPAVNAALGLEQLKKVDIYIEKKRRFNQIYREELDGLVKFQEPTPGSNPVWWMTACLFPENISVPELRKKLYDKGIPTREIFRPLYYYPHIKDKTYCPNAEYIYNHGLCLPSSVKNSDGDIRRICKTLKNVIIGQ